MIGIPLTQGQVALIDEEDFELVSRYKWHAQRVRHTNSFYAQTNISMPDGSKTHLQMHRLIMNAQPGELVDHIHHLTLDNRKSELRLCTTEQNAHNMAKHSDNTSGYKGVRWIKDREKWRAQIGMRGKKIFLGDFASPEMAYNAYCEAAIALHGEFARLS